MALPTKTRDDFLATLRAELAALNSNLNVSDHSVAYDISLLPASILAESLWLLADFINRTHSLSGIQQILNDDAYKEQLRVLFEYDAIQEVEDLVASLLDAMVGNWNITRNAAVAARGPVRFYVASSAAVTLAAGGRVSTRGTAVAYFTVLSGCTALTPSYDSARGLYYVELTVEAQTAGVAGNAAANRVSVLVDPFALVVACANPVTLVGGRDAESDDDLIARATSRWRAWSIDTKVGLEAVVEEQPGVDDAYVASRIDPLNTRQGDVAPVDVFVSVDSQPVSVSNEIIVADAIAVDRANRVASEAMSYPPTTGATFDYVFNRQPVTGLVSVVGILSAELLVDGGLEDWTSTTALTSWGQVTLGTSNLLRLSLALFGLYRARLAISVTDEQIFIYQTGIANAKTYVVSFWAATNKATPVTARVGYRKSVAPTADIDIGYPVLTTIWQRYEYEFTVNTGTDYPLYGIEFGRKVGGGGANYNIRFDNISLKEVISVPVAGCTFHQDTGSTSGSTRSRSYVTIPTSDLTTGETISITSTYDARVLSLQNTIDAPAYNLISSDVLIRSGYVLDADINLTAVFFSGGDYSTEADIQTTVESDLLVFFAGGITSTGRRYAAKKLGERIDASDILQVVLEVTGVDRIDTFTLVIGSTTVTSFYQPKNSEYVRCGDVVWL